MYISIKFNLKVTTKSRKVYKGYLFRIDMRSLKISDKIWKMLMTIKLKYGYKSIDEIIESLLKIVPKNELEKKK